MKKIIVKEIIGDKASTTDAIIIRELIEESLLKNKTVKIDFNDVSGIDCYFLSSLFTNLICKLGRKFIENHILAINLKDYSNFNRVIYGTSFTNK